METVRFVNLPSYDIVSRCYLCGLASNTFSRLRGEALRDAQSVIVSR